MGASLAFGCNLENALGVDGDGATSMDAASGSTGSATDEADGTGTSAASTTEGPTTEDSADSSDSGPPPTDCAGRTARVATFNVLGVGAPGSTEYRALADIVRRMDADVICFQEVLFYEGNNLSALAEDTGYMWEIQANEPPAIGGDFTNACMGRSTLMMVGSYSSGNLSDDPGVNDVGRDILAARVDLSDSEATCHLGLVALHLKSGTGELDEFRRQVEAERVAQVVEIYENAFPDDPMVIMGDLNETIDDPDLGTVVFPEEPAGLPPSYQTGSDIQFPMTYRLFDRFADLGFEPTYATQEDSGSLDATFYEARLDYIMVSSGAQVVADEVYNACRDDGVDEPPMGNWMEKAGQALPCAVSFDASDHLPVMADLLLP